MTTALITGLSYPAAVDAVRAAAYGIWTETGRSKVMVGVAIDGAAAVLEIDRAEYCGLRLGVML